MWKCETVTDELLKARERRTKLEKFGRREKYIEGQQRKRG
jgi:hypothetical protein